MELTVGLKGSIGSPCYALAGFLPKIQSPSAGRSESFVRNSSDFIYLLESVNFQFLVNFVSFDVVNLFTNVPVDGAPQVVSSKLHNDYTLVEQSAL
jgi:hypothetical protein